jgi:eukaryotic-like serine/threonine-protein kinase
LESDEPFPGRNWLPLNAILKRVPVMGEREMFLAALELDDPRARALYLDQACSSDAALRATVEALLKSHEEAGSFLEEPAAFDVGATVAQTRPIDPLGDAAGDLTAAGSGHSPEPTQAQKATQAYDPDPLAGTSLALEKATGVWTPDANSPTQTADGHAPSRVLARGTAVRYFGDYEIQNELGRGGMGVVYKARQVSLNRPVALKMIKAGVLADDSDLRRFQNEAEAVARLDHAGIVPVYEVGEHQGQCYFSMKLVEGGNVAEQLSSFKDNPRAAAILLAETAEAVQHAHMRGILHRDLKPANILVDPEGHPHVTDFGLAKRVEEDVEMTASGAILGTPAYMSPEQAAGRRGTITTATDVHGLGAILYALLTAKAPFGGDNLADTLQAVKDRPPESPRSLNANVPRDLETICLKCLAKDPQRRYSSAQALADDLRCWLDSRPITARRVGSAERACLWCKRRPAVAALAAAVMLALVAGTTGVFTVQAVANANLRSANGRLDTANTELKSSNIALDRQRARAEERETLAIDAVKKFRDAVENNDELKDNASLESLRKALLKEPLVFFRGLHASLRAASETTPESLARLASASFDLGDLTQEIGDEQDALAAFRESLASFRKLADAYPFIPAYQRDLAACRNSLGDLLSKTGRTDEARTTFEEALPVLRKLTEAHPKVAQYQRSLAASHVNFGNLLKKIGRTDEARTSYEAALAIFRTLADENPGVTEHQRDLATCDKNFGNLLRATGRMDEARTTFEAALVIQKKLADAHPSVARFQNDLAACHYDFGSLLDTIGLLDKARAAYGTALAIQKKLADAHPSVTRYQHDLATSHNNLGLLLSKTGPAEEARTELEAGLAVQQKLADAHPSVTQYQRDLAATHGNLGNLFTANGQPAEARTAIEATVTIFRKLSDSNPESPDFKGLLGNALNNMAALDLLAKRFESAHDKLREAIACQRKALAANPRHPIYRKYLTNHLYLLIMASRGLGRTDEADEAERELNGLEANDPTTAALDARLAAVLKGEAPKTNAERLDLAQRAYDKSLHAAAARLFAEAFAIDPKLADNRQAQFPYNAACAASRAAAGKGTDSPPPDDAAKAKLRQQALEWLQAELAVWTKLVESGPRQTNALIAQTLKHWQDDTDLTGIRDDKAIAALPESERAAWRTLWADVAALLEKARAVAEPAK